MPAHRLVPQNAADPSVGRSALRILIVAVPPMRTLDVFGPSEVFGDANWLRGGAPAYEVNIISACADRVVSNHLGTGVHTDRTYREYRGPIDTLLVAGYMGPRELHYEPGLVAVDVALLRAIPDLPSEWLISGLVYDVATGLVEIVVPPALIRAA
jgi:hypothetical protein